MVVRLDARFGLGRPAVAAEPPAETRVLTRAERLARLQRRRRSQAARVALENAAWISGTAGVLFLVASGLLGLR
jgi:hypothetical protein